jgi:hypothetical protein
MPTKSIKATQVASKLPLVEIVSDNQALPNVVEKDNAVLLRCSPRKRAVTHISPKKQPTDNVDLFKSPLAKCATNGACDGGSSKKTALVSYAAMRSFAIAPQQYVSPVKGLLDALNLA